MTAVKLQFNFPREPPLPPIGRTGENFERPGSTDRLNVSTPDAAAAASGENAALSGKLTNVEAQRIMSVLLEAQKKVQLIGWMPDVVDRRTSTVLGTEAAAVISELRSLENRYKSLLGDDETSKTRPPAISSEAKEVARQIRHSTRTAIRHFLQSPTVASKLRYMKSTRPEAVVRFEQLLQEVKMLIYGRLGTTVEEEKVTQDQLSIIIAKEQKTSSEVQVLQEELEKARKERIAEINKKNEVIRRLKEELRDIKQQAEESTKRLETRSKQKEDSDMQQFRDKVGWTKHERTW
ncbi:hypothetical protein BC832DRAFT_169558 [Gaertneriomyces semiglobifer]|nr:hypothetical protein BC832DRAFT_169558 [Gaertneriomyces semiglobifer]